MFITELDAHGNCQRSSTDYDRTSINVRRVSTESTSTTSGEDYLTAANSLQRISSGGTGNGLGISGNAMEGGGGGGDGGGCASSSRPRMGSTSTITAAAAAAATARQRNDSSNWAGGILRQMDVRVESETQSRDLAGLDAELRRRSVQRLPRDGRLAPGADREALSELAHFLRNVTPPPGNYMSLPSPGSLSPRSSLRRRNSGKKQKRGPLWVALGLFRRATKQKKLHKKRNGSPPTRSPSVKKRKTPFSPRIKLPDTAVAGTTVEGHRHIAISIPIEHAHLGPEGYVFGAERRPRSLSSSSSSPLAVPTVYKDVNVRPMSAFVTEPLRVGTQLGPLAEERESLSSRSWEKSGGGSGSGAGPVGYEEAAAARKVRLASRNTFGTVHEYQELGGSGSGSGSRPGTAGGGGLPPALSPTAPAAPRVSDESSGQRTPRTSEEMRASTRAQALAALAGRPVAESGPAYVGSGGARPSSAYSFRSFATPSPSSRVYYPARLSSLHPGTETRGGRARSRSNSDGFGRGGGSWPGQQQQQQPQQPRSRDSSRDQTLQESIFSERSFLESLDTVGTGAGEAEGVVGEAKAARRFEGRDVVFVCETPPPRRSGESKRASGESSGGKGKQRASMDSNRASGGSGLSAGEKFAQRMSAEGNKRSSGGAASEKRRSGQGAVGAIVDSWEKRGSGGSAASVVGKGKAQAPAPIAVEAAAAAAAAAAESAAEAGVDEAEMAGESPVQASERRSRFVENITPPGQQQGAKDGERKVDKGKQKIEEVLDQTPSRASKQGPVVQGEAIRKPEFEEERRPRTRVQQIETEASTTDAAAMDGVRGSSSTAPVRQLETDVSKVEADDAQKPPSDTTGNHSQPTGKAWLEVPEIRLPKTPERSRSRSKGNQEERSPAGASSQEGSEKKSSSPIPSPKERRAKRQSNIMSRKLRIAELKAAFDQPGFQPSDLVLERRLSMSSNSSSSSSSGESTPRSIRMEAKRNTFPYPPNTTALTPLRPKSSPTALNITRVVTVADVRPSSPSLELELTRKGSVTLSISSPATTIMKASPIPPFRTLGSVTPPESPDGPPADDSPWSPIQLSSADPQSPPLRHKPSGSLKRISSRGSCGSRRGRSPTSPRSPGPRQGNSPPRPKTAGKGALPSKKELFRPATTQPSSSAEESKDGAAAIAGPSAAVPASVLRMSRSQIFDRYEALREKQVHDMEKRLMRLERNGEYWLTSMVPLLSDLSLTLGRLAEGKEVEGGPSTGKGKGKGKEIEKETTTTTRTSRRYGDDRQVQSETRGENVEPYRGTSKGTHLRANDGRKPSSGAPDDGEAVPYQPGRPSRRNYDGGVPELNRRLYLQDLPLLYPDLGYRVETRSFTDDDERGQPVSLSVARVSPDARRPTYRRSRTTTSLATGGARQLQLQQQQQQQQQQQRYYHHQQEHSGSTTVVDSATAPRANSIAASSSQRQYWHHDRHHHPSSPFKPAPATYLRDDFARLEKLNDRVSAGIRDLSHNHGRAASPPKAFAKRDRIGQQQQHGRRGQGPVRGGGGGGGVVSSRFSSDDNSSLYGRSSSSSSLRTYDDTDRSEAGTGTGMGPGRRREGRRRAEEEEEGEGDGYRSGRSGSGMDTVEPLMRELQVSGSRVSLESLASGDIGDDEVRRMKQGPAPARAVVGFGAFSI